MRRGGATVVAALVALACAPAFARAEIRLFTAAGVPAGTPVREDAVTLQAWSAAGAHLLVRRDGRTVRVSRAGVALGRAPGLDRAFSVGPGERSVAPGADAATLAVRAADGRVVAIVPRSPAWQEPVIAWSREGARVAIAQGREIVVLDTAVGAELLRWRGEAPTLSPQAFAPGGGALAVVDGARVVRLDLVTRAATVVHTAAGAAALDVAWSPLGVVAVADDTTLRVLGGGDVEPGAEALDAVGWSGDGTTLGYALARPLDACSPLLRGVGLTPVGGTPRVLVPPAEREVRSVLWSPDGTTLAVDLGPRAQPEPRGRRRPWPPLVARAYGMPTAAGNAAVRALVARAATGLRTTRLSREATLRQVRLDFALVAAEFPTLWSPAVRDRLTAELDRWLAGAGYRPIGGPDEVVCGAPAPAPP